MKPFQTSYRHLHILGASGSGATTLGRALSDNLPHTVLDGDDYFWARKFDEARPPEERARLLEADLDRHERWMLTGAVCGWGDDFKPLFDFVVFLHVPPEERLARLRAREIERYGEDVLPGGRMHRESQEFLEWAALYDHAGEEVRSLKLHERWMADLTCPILRIEGSHSVEERVKLVLEELGGRRMR
ncbi:AAA family ATPase [Saccharibacillus sp. CPCC 101409]|uniref:AAA family ATPase n=1 Tax=Saccharibacillus sp. CPCC 101409 TaxID=3058041 RepID=UPI0026720986|nr:AAA family ATPase [Saccharibacillus sp. CPCC 101409]MDO3411243.1 AAA family ATPase [Saccharibacillus sp. CPCC 101409]